MAELAQLEIALRNADKAGDTEAAKLLASEIVKMRSAPMVTPEVTDNYSTNPTEGMDWQERMDAATGAGMVNVARGIGQVLGLVDQESIDEAKKRDAPLMDTKSGALGNVVGGVAAMAPTALIPGANSALGAMLLGTASGAVAPVASDESRLKNTVAGGTAGLGGNLLSRALARVLNPQTSKAVTDLMDEGVTPTPGQILGPTAAKMESGLESIPFIGPTITRGKNDVMEEFNASVINRALAPIGAKVDDVGREAIDGAFTKVSQAYDDALAKIPQVVPDLQIDLDIQRAQQGTAELSKDVADQFDRIIQNRVKDKLSSAVSGDQFKKIHSDVLRLARQYRPSPDPDQRAMAGLLDDVAGSLSSLVARNNPAAAQELKAADTAYATLLRAAKASGNSADGVFSPRQLATAVKGMERSSNKVQYARGNSLLQDMSDAGQAVLGQNLPNSGTADRAMLAAALAGKATPGAVAGAVGTMGAYSPTGRKTLAALLAKRPDTVRAAGDLVRRVNPYTALAAAQAANQ